MGLVLLGLDAGPGAAAPGAGTLADPVIIDDFPYAVADDTTGRGQEIDLYACATNLDESGPEVVYRLDLPNNGRLVAWVEGDDYVSTDIDVHLLGATTVSGGEATSCIARSNLALEVDQLSAGTYWLVVDTYVDAGTPLPGPYELRVDFIPYDTWRDRVVARGVVWRQRLYPDLYGDYQTANVLVIDPTEPDVSVVPVEGQGCETPASMGERVGAVAAVNAGFFASGCAPVGLVKIDGQLLATNGGPWATFGFDTAGGPLLDWVDNALDWPAAHHALGGKPMLVQGSAVDVAWELEGVSSSFTFNRHPRTAACIDVDGNVDFITFDGRTAAGGGVALDDLAEWMTQLGCADGMNFDGGGSTSMWIAGQPLGGVVNYPSDNGTADHAGARAVSNAWAVFAAPYNHPPRFTTTPAPLTVTESTPYAYDADALDLNVYDQLVFEVVSGPLTAAVDPVSGIFTWTPTYRDGGPQDVVLSVTDGEHTTTQPFTLTVEVPDGDGDGLPDTWETEYGTDPATPDGDADPDGDGYTNLEEYTLGSDPQDPDDPSELPPDGGTADAGDATSPGGGSGCGCHTPPESGSLPALPWLLLVWVLWMRGRPSPQNRQR